MMFSLMLCWIFRDKSVSQMRRESEICNATAILEVSGKLFIDELESGPIDSSGFYNFHFPIDFIGGQ